MWNMEGHGKIKLPFAKIGEIREKQAILFGGEKDVEMRVNFGIAKAGKLDI